MGRVHDLGHLAHVAKILVSGAVAHDTAEVVVGRRRCVSAARLLHCLEVLWRQRWRSGRRRTARETMIGPTETLAGSTEMSDACRGLMRGHRALIELERGMGRWWRCTGSWALDPSVWQGGRQIRVQWRGRLRVGM